MSAHDGSTTPRRQWPGRVAFATGAITFVFALAAGLLPESLGLALGLAVAGFGLTALVTMRVLERHPPHRPPDAPTPSAPPRDVPPTSTGAPSTRDEFLATVSHELRTPLHGVIGMSDLLLESELGPDQRETATTIRNSAEALLRIVNDILSYTRLTAGRLDLEIVAFDPHLLVEEVVDLVAQRAFDKGLEIGCLIAPDVPNSVRADSGRLRQILLNLVDNAVKFTEQGHILVDLQRDGDHLKFVVRDTGIGIDPRVVANIFEPFTQVDTMGRRHSGTGLGLTISKRLIETMGGTLVVDSTPGHGSTFTVTAKITHPTAPAPLQSGGGRAIVVAAPHSAALMASRLAHHGFTPLELDLTTFDHPQDLRDGTTLLAIDVGLLGSDDSLIASRALARAPGVPAILYGRTPQKTGDTFAQSIGALGYLTKPVHEAALVRRLETVLSPHAHHLTAAPHHAAARPNPDGPCVLVVEDNPVNQLVATRLLERLGCRVDVVADGQEALTAIGAHRYQLVLMDIHMPVLDGFAATRIIRADEDERRLPIVAMTANVMPGVIDECRHVGMDDYISKPVQLDALARTLERWIPGLAAHTP